jgi:hypothetical protein
VRQVSRQTAAKPSSGLYTRTDYRVDHRLRLPGTRIQFCQSAESDSGFFRIFGVNPSRSHATLHPLAPEFVRFFRFFQFFSAVFRCSTPL